jgi:hypothetical protein
MVKILNKKLALMNEPAWSIVFFLMLQKMSSFPFLTPLEYTRKKARFYCPAVVFISNGTRQIFAESTIVSLCSIKKRFPLTQQESKSTPISNKNLRDSEIIFHRVFCLT